MKRWLQTAMSIILVGTLALTAVVPALAIDMPYLRGTFGSGLTMPPDDATTLNWNGTMAPGGASTQGQFGADVYCTGDLCWKIDFYAEFTASVNYTDSAGGASGYDISWTFGSQGASNVKITDSIHCSDAVIRTPNRATCEVHGYVRLPASMVDTNPAVSEAVLTFNLLGNIGPSTNAETWTVDVTISAEPINIDPCDDAYQDQGIVQDGEIDPTSETGSQVTNLDVGSDYRLSVTGGPWISANAPTVNRYDTAIKVDDEDWQSIELAQMEDNVQCLQNSDDGHSFTIVFEALDPDFAIRVDDLVGEFADNSYPDDPITWEISKVVPAVADTGCGGQFLQGNLLGTYVLDGNDSIGERITIPAPGKYVQVVVQDATYWQDDGSGPELRTIAIEPGQLPWFTLEAYPFSECADTTLGVYYFQVANKGSHFLRVADTGSNWAANTGSLTVNIYSATFDPFPSECEGHYKIGDMIETKVVSGNSPVGVTINDGEDEYPPLPVGGEREDVYRYLMMEIVNGPFWDGTAYSAATEVYYGPSATWHASIVFPTATCISLLDGLGRTRIYFPYDPSIDAKVSATPWKFRPHDMDSSWGNNTGYIGYTIYKADFLDADNCDQFYTPEATGEPITVMGNDETGSSLLSLEPGSIYAIETSAGPWVDGGVSKYDIAFSTDDGDTWEAVQMEDLFLCKSEDGNYITAYFQALEGADYRVRVNDEPGDFGTNTGWMHVTMYAVSADVDPWGSCADDYILGDEMVVPENQRMIAAYDNTGLLLPLDVGNTYAVEIGENEWVDGLTQHLRYAEIWDGSTTNGSILLEPTPFQDVTFALCVVRIPDLNYATADRYRIYFDATTTYTVRADDQNGIWGDNRGSLDFHYYLVSNNNNPDDDNSLPPYWSTSCYEPCMRPDHFFKSVTIDLGLGDFSFPVPAFDDWIEFARCAIQKYFAWCPQHTAYLMSLTNSVTKDKDPFATIADLGDFYSFAKQLIESSGFVAGGESNWPLGGGGETSDGNVMDILTPSLDHGTSPWFGGQLDLTSGYSQGGEAPIVDTACTALSAVNQYWGDATMHTVCLVTLTMKTSPIFAVLFTVMDMILVVVMVFRYIPNVARRLWNMIVRNKGFIRTAIQ